MKTEAGRYKVRNFVPAAPVLRVLRCDAHTSKSPIITLNQPGKKY